MKALKILAFSSIVFLLQGCYTILWTPDIDLPTKDTSENSDSYYEEPYYGEYYPYYELPWWYTLPPATYSSPVKPRGPLVTKVREGGTTDRPTESPRRPDSPIIVPVAGNPTVDQPTTTTPTTTTTDDNSTKRTESSSTPSRERTTSTNSRDTRNNDGSRSSDPPRR